MLAPRWPPPAPPRSGSAPPRAAGHLVPRPHRSPHRGRTRRAARSRRLALLVVRSHRARRELDRRLVVAPLEHAPSRARGAGRGRPLGCRPARLRGAAATQRSRPTGVSRCSAPDRPRRRARSLSSRPASHEHRGRPQRRRAPPSRSPSARSTAAVPEPWTKTTAPGTAAPPAPRDERPEDAASRSGPCGAPARGGTPPRAASRRRGARPPSPRGRAATRTTRRCPPSG